MTRLEKILVFVLRIYGIVAASAILAVFMPREWMEKLHEEFDLGTFPDAIIVDYLARSLAAFYAMFGVLLWILSRDVRRYRSIVRYTACASIAFGALVLVLGLDLGLPPGWVAGEGPSIIATGILILGLCAGVKRDS